MTAVLQARPTVAGSSAVDAHAAVAVDDAGRLVTLRSCGPLQLRPGRAGSPMVRLATGIGGPLRGDSWCLDLDVGRGACLVLRAVAASVALPGRETASATYSQFAIHARVASGGWLDVDLGPTVAADGAVHHQELTLDVEAGGGARWREELVLGRHGERGGVLKTRMDVRVDGHPLLRHRLLLDPDDIAGAAATTAGARVLASELLVGGAAARGGGYEVALHPTAPAVRLPLAGPGWLATSLANDVPTARRWLATVLPGPAG